MKPTNVMIDIETLGTKPGCIILSIGATTFLTGEDPRDKFYEKIDPNSCRNYGLDSELSTMNWWLNQSQEARDEAFSGIDSMYAVLNNFRNWLVSLNNTVVVWSKAASFDLKILEAAYAALDERAPWDFRNEMCFRTLELLYKDTVPKPPFAGVKHNALDDAINQADHAEMIFKFKEKCLEAALFLSSAAATNISPAQLVKR